MFVFCKLSYFPSSVNCCLLLKNIFENCYLYYYGVVIVLISDVLAAYISDNLTRKLVKHRKYNIFNINNKLLLCNYKTFQVINVS